MIEEKWNIPLQKLEEKRGIERRGVGGVPKLLNLSCKIYSPSIHKINNNKKLVSVSSSRLSAPWGQEGTCVLRPTIFPSNISNVKMAWAPHFHHFQAFFITFLCSSTTRENHQLHLVTLATTSWPQKQRNWSGTWALQRLSMETPHQKDHHVPKWQQIGFVCETSQCHSPVTIGDSCTYLSIHSTKLWILNFRLWGQRVTCDRKYTTNVTEKDYLLEEKR